MGIDYQRRDRWLAWLAILVLAVLVVCVVGEFSRPIEVAHFDAKSRAYEPLAEIFVPPPQAPVPAVASVEMVVEATATIPAPAAPAVVPVTEAVAPLVAPVMPGLAALKPISSPEVRAVQAPVVFTPGAQGSFPNPPYPRWARQQGMQGKLQLLVEVSASGSIDDLKVRETSGHDLLDKHVLDWVKANWSWAPGARRRYLVPFVFELQ